RGAGATTALTPCPCGRILCSTCRDRGDRCDHRDAQDQRTDEQRPSRVPKPPPGSWLSESAHVPYPLFVETSDRSGALREAGTLRSSRLVACFGRWRGRRGTTPLVRLGSLGGHSVRVLGLAVRDPLTRLPSASPERNRQR